MRPRTLPALAVLAIALTSAHAQFGKDPFGVSVSTAITGTGQKQLTVDFTIPDRHFIYADKISLEGPDGVGIQPESIPEPKHKQDPFSGSEVGVYDHDVSLHYAVTGQVVSTFDITVGYQGCNDSICFLPASRVFTVRFGIQAAHEQTSPPTARRVAATRASLLDDFEIVGTAAGYLPRDEFLAFLDNVETGRAPQGDRLRRALAEHGVWLLILLILAGGLALNLTPCVLPMIPVNIAIIGAGTQAGSRARGFALGATYGVGIAVVYGILGLVAVFGGARFGTLNASPWFNAAVAVLFAVMALAMFGLFTVDFSKYQNRMGPSSLPSGRFLTAFVFGGVAALLAGACVAPVLISVLLLCADLYSKSHRAALLLPFLLGIGMALPWPFAGAGLSFLPKPGKWMERIKIGFGVVILLVAFWYGHQAVSLFRDRFGADPQAIEAAQKAHLAAGWTDSLSDGLRRAASEGKPVFIDCWASWCKNCLRMEQTTFRDADVKARLNAYVRVKFRAEDLNDSDTRAVLDHFDAIGLPVYAVLRPPEK